jgi:cell wall-associated NlpC family hydrolase
MALAVPATVAFAPVHPAEPVRWEPQLVVAVQPVKHVRPAAAVAVPSAGSRAGAIAVQAALTRLGDPYVWAAAGPHAFDCSGLVVWSFEQAGLSLPHSSQQLALGGQPVALDQIRPGDVITYYDDASHVGLYVGGGKIVHASTYGVPVAVASMKNAPIYNVRRYR